jgi:hypothetical protein
MAKTAGVLVAGEFVHKLDTPTRKFAAYVNGEYMETTAVSQARAFYQLKARYNKQHGFVTSGWVEVQWTTPRQLRPIMQPMAPAEGSEPEEKPVTKFPLFDLLE